MSEDICDRLSQEIATWGGQLTTDSPPIVILLRDAKAEIERLTRERDEARIAAQAGYQSLGKPKSWNLGERARLLMRWPWLEREGEG